MKENREIDLSNLFATVFKEFVISRKKKQKDGSFVNLSFEGLSVRQNPNLFFFFFLIIEALTELSICPLRLLNYKDCKVQQPQAMVVELADFYKSLERRETAEKEKGIRPVQVGKEALPFNIYKMLAQHFVESGNVFAWAYLVVSWNLICRTKNTESLKLSHIEWNEDAMIVYCKNEK